jgi:hypothetical protein
MNVASESAVWLVSGHSRATLTTGTIVVLVGRDRMRIEARDKLAPSLAIGPSFGRLFTRRQTVNSDHIKPMLVADLQSRRQRITL